MTNKTSSTEGTRSHRTPNTHRAHCPGMKEKDGVQGLPRGSPAPIWPQRWQQVVREGGHGSPSTKYSTWVALRSNSPHPQGSIEIFFHTQTFKDQKLQEIPQTTVKHFWKAQRNNLRKSTKTGRNCRPLWVRGAHTKSVKALDSFPTNSDTDPSWFPSSTESQIKQKPPHQSRITRERKGKKDPSKVTKLL